MEKKNIEVAILAGGCFWCTEAVYNLLNGIEKVEPGYIGGVIENPTYNDISTGNTGHAEAIRIEFDANVISYEELLEVFFSTHDPTTLNKQGADVGTQYRSEIFFVNNMQQVKAENFINWLNTEKVFKDPIVTKMSSATKFYVAENYHKDYYENNPNNSYCVYVINPKIEKLKKYFSSKIK